MPISWLHQHERTQASEDSLAAVYPKATAAKSRAVNKVKLETEASQEDAAGTPTPKRTKAFQPTSCSLQEDVLVSENPILFASLIE